MHEVKKLTNGEFLQLFSWHAFEQDRPIEVYMEHSERVVKYCGGLLLALQLLRSLKVLNLYHFSSIMFDFSNVPNLESLILINHINLIEFHESIWELGRLVLPDLKDCKNLRKLPSGIGQLKSPENLILSGCSKLFQLPIELGRVESLKLLLTNRTAINQSLLTSTDLKSCFSHLCYWGSGPRENLKAINFSDYFTTLVNKVKSCRLQYTG
ncbi:disease resistance protein RUN1-like [Cornus florida]|uniref:disease resistance protein RUN1-like n=1 Tax=Cornus florida TaxID=4283 RepID=UPI0028A08848|nr:disease resistance protein RUN1-like [Cornus florida]